tara:strand:- start:9595 stop:9999 length:405 start_codon:yes stop_codon:yes gene_type:complete
MKEVTRNRSRLTSAELQSLRVNAMMLNDSQLDSNYVHDKHRFTALVDEIIDIPDITLAGFDGLTLLSCKLLVANFYICVGSQDHDEFEYQVEAQSLSKITVYVDELGFFFDEYETEINEAILRAKLALFCPIRS